ncbi:MAG: hypothetical protein A2Y16_05355 [Tenericutes bacterium GWF2_57_13]|nr:MAG: hypothetical protein A2Y16_05355 [Tenericutes bacterium GWF2_57_13]
MLVLKNYKVLEGGLEDFQAIQIIDTGEVFAELPICAVEFGKKLKRPLLYTVAGKPAMAVEYDWLMIELSRLRKFCLTINPETGKLSEVPPEQALFVQWMPPDTNLDELIIDRGNIVRVRVIEKSMKEAS